MAMIGVAVDLYLSCTDNHRAWSKDHDRWKTWDQRGQAFEIEEPMAFRRDLIRDMEVEENIEWTLSVPMPGDTTRS